MKKSIPPHPPFWVLWLLERFVSTARQEDLLGDLYELFHRRVKQEGERKAKVLFVRDTFLLLIHSNLTTTPTPMPSPTSDSSMLSHYLTLTFRVLKRQKAFSFLNLGGLSAGIAFCLLIFLFVKEEYSFDQFHENADHLYRLELINTHAQASNSQTHKWTCYL